MLNGSTFLRWTCAYGHYENRSHVTDSPLWESWHQNWAYWLRRKYRRKQWSQLWGDTFWKWELSYGMAVELTCPISPKLWIQWERGLWWVTSEGVFSSVLWSNTDLEGCLLLCCCSVTKSRLTICDPMDCSMSGFPVLHCLPEFAHTRVHWVGMPSKNHLILYSLQESK